MRISPGQHLKENWFTIASLLPERKYSKSLALVMLYFVITVTSGCTVKMSSFGIAPDVKTYFVGQFKTTALNAPATINQTFSEALKDKISKESRLQYSEEDPHIQFNGTVQGYNVSAVAPLPGETTSFNRLTIVVNVEYINALYPKNDWTKSFSHFEDFPTDANLLQVQDELIQVIFTQILEDIFNQAFNNW